MTPASRPVTRTEPVAVVEIVRLIIAALVAAGWVTLDTLTIEIIISVVGGIVSLALSLWARKQVTPLPGPVPPPIRAPDS